MENDFTLYCRDCKEKVHPKIITEYQGERPHGGYVDWMECPTCGGDNLCEWTTCGECTEPIPWDKEYCEECINRVQGELKELCSSYLETDYDTELILVAMGRLYENGFEEKQINQDGDVEAEMADMEDYMDDKAEDWRNYINE